MHTLGDSAATPALLSTPGQAISVCLPVAVERVGPAGLCGHGLDRPGAAGGGDRVRVQPRAHGLPGACGGDHARCAQLRRAARHAHQGRQAALPGGRRVLPLTYSVPTPMGMNPLEPQVSVVRVG